MAREQRVEFYTALDFPDVPTDTKIASNFLSPPVVVTLFQYPYPPATSYDWKRGFPKKEITYNNAGLPLKSDEYFYNSPIAYDIKYIPSFSTSRYTISNLSNNASWNWHLFGKNNYTSSFYPLQKKISRVLVQVEQTI